MNDRMVFMSRLSGFVAGLDRTPTTAEIRAFVESLTPDERTRFLVAALTDAVAGLKPLKAGRRQA